jgi:hypothetical protein
VINEHVCPRIALEEAVRTGDTSWKEKVRI